MTRLPDSPAEPDPEVPLERTDRQPTVIPLDDVTGNPENLYDHRHVPWPEPKVQTYGQHFAPPQYKSAPHVAPVDPYHERHMPRHMAGPPAPEIPLHGPPIGMPIHHNEPRGAPAPAGGSTWMVIIIGFTKTYLFVDWLIIDSFSGWRWIDLSRS